MVPLSDEIRIHPLVATATKVLFPKVTPWKLLTYLFPSSVLEVLLEVQVVPLSDEVNTLALLPTATKVLFLLRVRASRT